MTHKTRDELNAIPKIDLGPVHAINPHCVVVVITYIHNFADEPDDRGSWLEIRGHCTTFTTELETAQWCKDKVDEFMRANPKIRVQYNDIFFGATTLEAAQ